jgi:tetratricopeptide (TPR) repeat protein
MLRAAFACALIAVPAVVWSGQRGLLEVTARIVLEDGSPLTSSPLILSVPGSEANCVGQQLFLGGTLRLRISPIPIRGEPQQGCDISVVLSGYRRFTGYVKEGTVIVLRRIGPNEGSAVSTVSLNAPADARKQYEAGESAAGKRKWPQAEEHLRQAVALYPPYALAWSELGQVLQDQGRLPEATEAFEKARAADPLYIKPVVQLARASSLQQHWEDEMRISEEALKMHPVEFPAAYYYHAEAVFHLGKLEDAERLTREALKLDPGGTCPESVVLLGEIFEKQGNTHDAIIEYRNYLEVAPHGEYVKQAKDALARLKQPK